MAPIGIGRSGRIPRPRGRLGRRHVWATLSQVRSAAASVLATAAGQPRSFPDGCVILGRKRAVAQPDRIPFLLVLCPSLQTPSRVARFGPTTPTRARRLDDASVDPTDARKTSGLGVSKEPHDRSDLATAAQSVQMAHASSENGALARGRTITNKRRSGHGFSAIHRGRAPEAEGVAADGFDTSALS